MMMMMTPIWLFLAVALVLAVCGILLVVEINRLQARTHRLERRLENAHVSVSTFCGAPAPHTHSALISFPYYPPKVLE